VNDAYLHVATRARVEPALRDLRTDLPIDRDARSPHGTLGPKRVVYAGRVGDPFVADPALLARAIDHAATIAKRRRLFRWADDEERLRPSMTREAALDVLRRLPPPSVRASAVTGIWTWEPHEATGAVRTLAHGGHVLLGDERALLERALAHYERLEGPSDRPHVTLRRASRSFLPELLGADAIPHLLEEVAHDVGGGRFALQDLRRLGGLPRDAVISVCGMEHLAAAETADYVRTRFAYDAGLATLLRATQGPHAARALSLGALDHDHTRLRAAWIEHRERLPPWRVTTAFVPHGLVPCDGGVACLIDQDTRRWVRGFELELWPNHGLRRNPSVFLYSLARHDPERRIVLLAPPDDEGLLASLGLASDRDALRLAIASAGGSDDFRTREGRLCLPRISRVLAPHGVESITWLDAEHWEGMRVGGLTHYELDRPFLIIDWDARREEALGVGLVTGPLLLEDTLAAVDASARGEGPFVDDGLRKRSWGD